MQVKGDSGSSGTPKRAPVTKQNEAAGNERPWRPCSLLELGRVDYLQTWHLQKQLAEARYNGGVGDLLLLLEHPHTYTTGRAGKDAHILFDDALLAQVGAAFHRVDRGGDITYHGPGQLVAYPIIDLRIWLPDVHQYLRSLEEVLIRTLQDFGIRSGRVREATGVWVGDKKIAAIGVRLTRWITSHGFALNVNTDLRYFENIVPCGLHGRGVTSMAKVLDRTVDPEEVAHRLATHFGQEFQFSIFRSTLAEIEAVAASYS